MCRHHVPALTAAWIAALACASCIGREPPSSGGVTHWLDACASDRECGDEGLICVCGNCTRSCSGDPTCGGGEVEAACYNVASPALQQRCDRDALEAQSGICLGRCRADADCAGGKVCVQGACVPKLGAAQLDSHDDHLSTEVSWSEPVMRREPVFTIEGGDERILGSWLQQPCPGGEYSDRVCLRLSIVREASGEVRGTLTFESIADPTHQPYAPPADPDVGYPVELDPSVYYVALEHREANIPYRLFDARFENGRLKASWSPADLWHEWCQWQTPHAWDVDGQKHYYCAPQDPAARAGIDPGKLDLCSPLEFGPLCESEGGSAPCECTLNPSSDCSGEVCVCDRDRCDADQQYGKETVELVLTGNRMAGDWFGHPFERLPLVLGRTSP